MKAADKRPISIRDSSARAESWISSERGCGVSGVMMCALHSQEMSLSTTMTVRLEDDIKNRLDVLAEATQRSKSFWAAEAIREYVELNEWQIQETSAALAEADAGDFASDKEVAALAKKWKVNAA